MKVLVIGSGGREHALTWKVSQSPLVDEVIVAPGNAGMVDVARCVDVKADDLEGLIALAQDEGVGLVVVGPEAPLVEGITDRFEALGILCFGPNKAAARLEASKAFTKEIADKAKAPTARYGNFTDAAEAKAFLDTVEPPYVLKADGLAAGKGVVILNERAEAEAEIDAMLGGKFGAASQRLVIEEFMHGEEASLFALVDGDSVIALDGAQDHKRAFDGDQGPNTGGMGAYSPAPILDEAMRQRAMDEIVIPCIKAMADVGAPYRGVLFAGLMIDDNGPRLVEFNVRFGDPECQILMARLESDIVPYLLACAGQGRLSDLPPLSWSSEPAVTVVMAANGYPDSYDKGSEIRGIDEANALHNVMVFHAGTKMGPHDAILANGGRVLNVTALGEDLKDAVYHAYQGVDLIDWPEGFCRRDIAWRALER
ncbi:phosphoribosylamine--glycine ligase [Woodsholea maritima]|uniref:phosphoribosylamine--glycine ligase n=1 Tax=Woodsholea maritima TaxID=240237 RepID=UPI000361C7D3|nr:phosphoribosylamine--glycine ligase [Woodsholea maritima]